MYRAILFIIVIVLGLLINYTRKLQDKRIYKLLIISLLLILSLFFAIREFILDSTEIGTDYYEYKEWFELRNFSNFTFKSDNIGYNLMISIYKSFFNNYYLFLFLCALIINAGVIKFIENNSEDMCMSIAVYLTFFYPTTFNIMRQWIALGIILAGFNFIKSKQLFKYLLTVLVAMMFHSTAVVMIGIYVVLNLKTSSTIKCIAIIVCGIVLYITVGNVDNIAYIISNLMNMNYSLKYNNYLGGLGNYTSVVLGAICLAVIYVLRQTKKHQANKDLDIPITYLGMYVSFGILSTKSFLLNRLMIYFCPAFIMSFPYTIELFANNSKMVAKFMIYAILFLKYAGGI